MKRGDALMQEAGIAAALLTPTACLQARQLLGWSTVRLSGESGVSTTTLRKIETGSTVSASVLRAIRIALESVGIVFGCDDNDGLTVQLRARS